MSGSPVELELRPKPLAAAFLRRFGETREQARHRVLTVAIPAAAVPLGLLVLRIQRSAQDDGRGQAFLGLSLALAVVAVLVGIMFLAHTRQRVTVEGDHLAVRTLWRTRRHPRHAAYRAVSHQLQDVSHLAPATFVVDPWGNCLVVFSWAQWERAEIERLLEHLRLRHDERLDEVLSLGQMRRRYPGAFTFSRRRPGITGTLGAIALVVVQGAVVFLLVD
jgi:hypothetical protein